MEKKSTFSTPDDGKGTTFSDILQTNIEVMKTDFDLYRDEGDDLKFRSALNVKDRGYVVPDSVEEYLKLIELPGTYCEETEIMAYEKLTGVKVHTTKVFANEFVYQPPPFEPTDERTIHVYYESRHYRSMVRKKVG